MYFFQKCRSVGVTLRLGVARLAERSTRCASVPWRGEHSALCDGAPKECRR